jgi:hypothetical protein
MSPGIKRFLHVNNKFLKKPLIPLDNHRKAATLSAGMRTFMWAITG